LGELVRDPKSDRTFYLDSPESAGSDEFVFILNLHGGGSSGQWQHGYFPADEVKDEFNLVIATPTAATAEPSRRWVAEADDEHLQNVVELVAERFGKNHIGSFWLVGHSQGGMTSNRLLRTPFFAERVDGWLSLSGGRLGPAERAPDAGRPGMSRQPGSRPTPPAGLPDADFSFIFSVGEHEIASLPDTSPWADRYGAGERQRVADVVDDQPGKVFDGRSQDPPTKAWGRLPRPGVAELYVYPDAKDGRVIADIVRLDKGHTEGLEPNITRRIVELMCAAPGGKLQRR
jgi:hypothetical protein